MLNEIGEKEELEYLLKLHHTVQKVKGVYNENQGMVKMLGETFEEIHDMLAKLQKAQSKSTASTQDKKKDDKGKGGKK